MLSKDRLLQGRMGSGAIASIPLKPRKVTLLTMILYNLENSIRDVRPFLSIVLYSRGM